MGKRKMKSIMIVSDIHLEHWGLTQCHKPMGDIFRSVEFFEPDVLVVAGDLNTLKELATTLRDICRTVKIPVVFVYGNHEFYGHYCNNEKYLPLQKTRKELSELENLHVLEHGEGCCIKGIHFFGLTGWIDESYERIHYDKDSPEYYYFKSRYNDFNYIRDFSDTLEIGKNDILNLRNNISNTFNASVKTIVVSHYIPCIELISMKYAGSRINRCFANNWAGIIKDLDIDYWIYGHTHDKSDQLIKDCKTRFMCNPVGYPTEGLGYIPNIIILED